MVRLNKRMPGPLLLGKNLDEKWKLNEFEIVNGQSINNSDEIFGEMIRLVNLKREKIDWNTINDFGFLLI